jgi:hypothetical protein
MMVLTQTLTSRSWIGGFKSFDNNCIFGNAVEMNFDEVMQLKAEVESFPRPAVKDYVCTMTKSYVAPFGGRMVTN